MRTSGRSAARASERPLTTRLARGLEGVVAKRLDSRYVPGERAWVKTKNRETWWRYELEGEAVAARR